MHLIETVLTSLRKLSKKSTEKREKNKQTIKMKRCRDGVPKYTHYTPSRKKKKKGMNE